MSSWCASSLGARVEASSLIYGERCSLGTLQGAKSLQLVALPTSWQPSWKVERMRIPTVEFWYKTTHQPMDH